MADPPGIQSSALIEQPVKNHDLIDTKVVSKLPETLQRALATLTREELKRLRSSFGG